MIFKNGNTLTVVGDGVTTMPKIPVGVWIVKFNDMTGTFYLEREGDFTVPDKIYGDVYKWSELYLKRFKGGDRNLGILLKGLKGTGKSLLAKKICIDSNLPVILVTSNYSGTTFSSFMASLEGEMIIFIDEFEKVFSMSTDSDAQDGLLSLFDGVFPGKKLFLLTANDNRSINDAFKNRPGRIHYLQEFSTLSNDIILEVANDRLKDVSLSKELLSELNIVGDITMDIVVSVIDEMNFFEESAKSAIAKMNIRPETGAYVVTCTAYPDDLNEEESKKVGKLEFSEFYFGHPLSTSRMILNFDMKSKDGNYWNYPRIDKRLLKASDIDTISDPGNIILTYKGVKYRFEKKESPIYM